jgi:hypothetical protein
MKHERERDLLPAFTEPPEGTRAPTSAAFGVVVGKSTVHDVEALLAQQGLHCDNNSARAMMERKRAQTKAEIDALQAEGKPIDGVSGASMINHKSKMERNPQVRLSCEDVVGTALGDRVRPASLGRWLFVFDSESLPLRHVALRRKAADPGAALVDLTSTSDALTHSFGAPTRTQGDVDGASLPAQTPFPLMHPVKRTWSFTDLHAEVSVVNLGMRGLDINEVVEVPWPIRADAPMR